MNEIAETIYRTITDLAKDTRRKERDAANAGDWRACSGYRKAALALEQEAERFRQSGYAQTSAVEFVLGKESLQLPRV